MDNLNASLLALLGLAALPGTPAALKVDALPSAPSIARGLGGVATPPVPNRFRPQQPVEVDPLRDAPDPVIVPDNEARLSAPRAGRPPGSR